MAYSHRSTMASRILLILLLTSVQASANWLVPGEDEVAESLSVVDKAVKTSHGLNDELPDESSADNAAVAPKLFAYDEETGLDVTRDEAVLEVNGRKGGVTYLDTFAIHTDSDFTMFGQHIQSVVDMNMKMESTVEDLEEGGQAVDVLITSVAMTMSSPPIVIECNTENEQMAVDTPECSQFYDIVGTSSHYVVDDEGTIAETSEDESALEANSPLNKLQPSNQLEQSSRLLQLVPSYPIKPGESWDASADMGDMGSFVGGATLVGYKDYKGHDCAVITTEGVLTVDISKAAAAMGGAPLEVMQQIKVEDATMKSTMYFDYEEALPRWTTAEITMTMTMPNPLSEDRIQIPVHEIVETATEIKAD